MLSEMDLQKEIAATLEESAEVKRQSAASISGDIARGAVLLVDAYKRGNKSLIFGNGGSAADAQHYAAELVGRFNAERKALPAIALNVNTSTITSIGNDYGYDYVFVRQLEAHVVPGDVVIAISTSGNSPNILSAITRAKELGATVIALGGRDGGKMKSIADLSVIVPSQSTPRIQETHIAILHMWCDYVERAVTSGEIA